MAIQDTLSFLPTQAATPLESNQRRKLPIQIKKRNTPQATLVVQTRPSHSKEKKKIKTPKEKEIHYPLEGTQSRIRFHQSTGSQETKEEIPLDVETISIEENYLLKK